MKTKQLQKNEIETIVALIKLDGIVAIPTDTVYGLAVSSHHDKNYTRLKEVKERPDSKPFPLMVASLEQLETLVEMDNVTRHLVETFMPGAITFIFRKKADVFPFLEGQTTLGIRMADDAWVQEVISKVGHPIWLPSANKSGMETGTDSTTVLSQLEGLIEGVVLGESLKQKSSSVFDLTQDEIIELRAGEITLDEVKKVRDLYLEKA